MVQGSGLSWRLRRLILEDGILVSQPSPRGEGFVRRYCFSTHASIRSVDMGIAVLSYRSLPHWGRGTASAVDRVLSYTDRLRRSPPLFFMPPAPYPARCTRSLPHGGKGTAVAVDRVLSLTTYLRHTHCLFCSPLFSCRQHPIRLAVLATFPTRGRLTIRGERYSHMAVLPMGEGFGIWERGRTTKKTNRNGSPFLVDRLACVSEVAGRYRAKARKRAGLERCDRVSCSIQFISRG